MFSKGQGEGLSGVATRSRMNSYVRKLGGNEDQIESSMVNLYYFHYFYIYINYIN